MTTPFCKIKFKQTNHQPIQLQKHQPLSEHLTIQNSPVLFGCRTGICGTCLVIIKGDIPPPNPEEKELLEILAPGNKQARLACQIDLTSDIEIASYKEQE
ncbi:MAG: 2Fe-2S iron-sulfur cluster-binding protein [Scytonema sp. PMC 1069.18]|nr:2Fe-2S iron-sulfur cluster-binding protein [Scytonema sp. PMC 1069.18]MEC4883595.1 2Fe-2S iron-sulfur cluster-binding protein [Scytonema sp. PMC 1070.18]